MKNRNSSEKIPIYIAVFFILCLIVVLVLYFLGIIGGEAPTVDVVLNKEVIIEYEKENWKEVKEENYSKYNWKKFSVYEEGKKVGKYSLFISEKDFYLFEVSKSGRLPIDSIEESLYLGGKKESKFIEFEKLDISDEDSDYINSVLKSNSISEADFSNYLRGYKVVYDFDNDDEKEEMYVLSNAFSYSVNYSAYSLIFIKDGNETKYIYKSVDDSSNRYSMCSATLLGLVKIEDVDKVQIITKCGYFSNVNNDEFGIYQKGDNGYELLLYIK